MGAHRLQDDRTLDGAARIVGRGVMATSVALALAGTGAGLATATPDHGDGGEHGHGHRSGHGDAKASADCTPGDDALVGGLLGDLGLSGSSGSSGELCAEDGLSSTDEESAPSVPDPSVPDSAPGTDDGDAGARRSATTSAPAPPTNPADIPPAPGETKVTDIPDDPNI